MKIINKEDEKVVIIMEENDVLEVSSFYNTEESIDIKCIDSNIYIDELLVSMIKERALEEKEIEKMKKLLENEE